MLSFLPLLLLLTPALALPHDGLRLIKTSPTDPGKWYTESEKFSLFVSKHAHFVDATETPDLESFANQRLAAAAFPDSLSHVDEVNALLDTATTTHIADYLTVYTAYHNRYYRAATGAEAADWLFSTVKDVAQANPEITVEQFTHSAFAQKSIIARIPGTSTDKIVIGAHLDSVGTTATGRSPGADDNASGTFTILESLRVLVAAGFTPKNTLEFHWYAAEEGGLLGSRDVFRSYAAANAVVKAMLNQDMTGYSPNKQISIITDYTDAPLNAFLKLVAEEYSGLEVVESECGYACSDHGSAVASGYPASFLFEAPFGQHSPYIHSEKDTLDTVDLEHVLGHVKTTIGFAVEASDL